MIDEAGWPKGYGFGVRWLTRRARQHPRTWFAPTANRANTASGRDRFGRDGLGKGWPGEGSPAYHREAPGSHILI